MNIPRSLLAAAVLALSGAAANASVIYATSVDSFTQGANTVPGGVIAADRMDPDHALGAPDGKFLSLGLGGELIVSFGRSFSAPGALWEITFGIRDNHEEIVDVYAGLGGIFTYVATLINATGSALPFSFAGSFDQIKLIDVSPSPFRRDGFDVDAISVSAIPLPAGGLLLISALGGIAMLRRRMA